MNLRNAAIWVLFVAVLLTLFYSVMNPSAKGGGQAAGESAFETGYFAVRAALAKSVTDSARFVAAQGAAALPAPVVARLVSQIASRFGIVVSEKVAAQAAPRTATLRVPAGRRAPLPGLVRTDRVGMDSISRKLVLPSALLPGTMGVTGTR